MSKIDTQNINVLNYNENQVFVDSSKEHYTFSASRDGKNPSIVPMSLSELQYVSSNTDIIITGWLTFDEEDKEEIYKALRISNWEKILSNQEIEKILTHPTLETLQKLIDIESQTYFDRIRIVMFKLIRDGVDITTKVSDIVNRRYTELRNKQRKSSLILTKKDTIVSQETVKELADQNIALQSQLDEMKKMMEQLMNAKSDPSTKGLEHKTDSDSLNDTDVEVEIDKKKDQASSAVPPKKSPGRPPKNQK